MLFAAIPDNVRALSSRWRGVVRDRRELDQGDLAAAAYAKAAEELEAAIASAEDETRAVGVTEFAKLRGVQPGTVRKWCARKLLSGATKKIDGDWMIPIGATRVRRARLRSVGADT